MNIVQPFEIVPQSPILWNNVTLTKNNFWLYNVKDSDDKFDISYIISESMEPKENKQRH